MQFLLMTNIATVTSKGQITVPENVRELLNIQLGDKLLFEKVDSGNRNALVRVISSRNINRFYGILKSDKKEEDFDKIRKIAGKKYGAKYASIHK